MPRVVRQVTQSSKEASTRRTERSSHDHRAVLEHVPQCEHHSEPGRSCGPCELHAGRRPGPRRRGGARSDTRSGSSGSGHAADWRGVGSRPQVPRSQVRALPGPSEPALLSGDGLVTRVVHVGGARNARGAHTQVHTSVRYGSGVSAPLPPFLMRSGALRSIRYQVPLLYRSWNSRSAHSEGRCPAARTSG
jgi:hypothetical protein